MLAAYAQTTEGQWWKELLEHWALPGMDAGTMGLRLAIRDNYLNFYRRGQSVARVFIGRDGKLSASVHLKYLGADNVLEGKEYARLVDGAFVSVSLPGIPFVDGQTFPAIIQKTEGWTGKEKYFVDLAVADNASVVDLEVGLPRILDEGGAPRMDLAVLERGEHSAQIRLVFWEAKTIDDSRLRATNPDTAEVHSQLAKYVDYMSDDTRRIHAENEYRRNCQLIVELAKLAGKDDFLSPLIHETGNPSADFFIDPVPRLVIFEGKTQVKGKPCEIRRVRTWSRYQCSLDSRWKVKVFGNETSFLLA